MEKSLHEASDLSGRDLIPFWVQLRELSFNFCPIDRFGRLVKGFLGIAEFTEGRGGELGLGGIRRSGFHRNLREIICKVLGANLRIPAGFSTPFCLPDPVIIGSNHFIRTDYVDKRSNDEAIGIRNQTCKLSG